MHKEGVQCLVGGLYVAATEGRHRSAHERRRMPKEAMRVFVAACHRHAEPPEESTVEKQKKKNVYQKKVGDSAEPPATAKRMHTCKSYQMRLRYATTRREYRRDPGRWCPLRTSRLGRRRGESTRPTPRRTRPSKQRRRCHCADAQSGGRACCRLRYPSAVRAATTGTVPLAFDRRAQ